MSIKHIQVSTAGAGDAAKAVLEPYEYLLSIPREDVCAKMIDAFNTWLHVPEEALEVIARVSQMLLNANLLINDVEDGSEVRRGVPTAHRLYGAPWTLNCACSMYCLSLKEIAKLNNVNVITIYKEELAKINRGRSMDIVWRNSLTCPTEEEFLEMVDNKTGTLLSFAIKLMQATSKSETGFVRMIAIYLTVRDDYMNMQPKNYADDKGFCEDLAKGRFSFPIIHSIRTDPSDRRLLRIIKQRSSSVKFKLLALQLLEKTQTFAYCQSFLEYMEQQIRLEIKDLGGNKKLEAIMDLHSVRV
ncbi:geranylgeranyl pyrophosphate synthetase [Apophysomyces sp. BC1015]|nr:geranylgeranyl pyrophosphate synthetase [Apophysomyces sp. BC1015]